MRQLNSKQANVGRRSFLKKLSLLFGAALIVPLNACMSLSAKLAKKSFEQTQFEAAVASIVGNKPPIFSDEIEINCPEIAENGTIVPVEVKSNISNTQAIAILANNNPNPLIANYIFAKGAKPWVGCRVKMAKSSEVTVLVKVEKQYYQANKYIKVTVGGCDS